MPRLTINDRIGYSARRLQLVRILSRNRTLAYGNSLDKFAPCRDCGRGAFRDTCIPRDSNRTLLPTVSAVCKGNEQGHRNTSDGETSAPAHVD